MDDREANGSAPGRARLTDRRILVVGAGTRPSDDPETPGNGRAISVLAAREGSAVACADRDPDAAGETVRLIGADSPGTRTIAITADVADPDRCADMVAEAHASLGGLDGVVLNVGIGLGVGLAGTTVEEWDLVQSVNLRAHFLVARAALPVMDEGGAFVFVSSVAALRAGTTSPAYDSSKAGLLGLCRHVAVEASGRGIRANAVIPGLIDTPMGRGASGQRPSRDRAAARVPLKRQGTAWEVAYATIFLLSGEASYVTGQTLVVDGGLTAR